MKSGTVNKHRGSTLLKTEENEQVYQLIGNRCQVKTTLTKICTCEHHNCHYSTMIMT